MDSQSAGFGADSSRTIVIRINEPEMTREGHVVTAEKQENIPLSAHRLRVTYADGVVREMSVNDGQTILEAAEENGVPIVNSCQAGVCGTCVARCTSGDYELDTSIGLSQAEKDAGRILACQTVPTTDCEIFVDYPLENNAARMTAGVATVAGLERVGANVALLTLDVSGLEEALKFAPGQFAQLKVPGTSSWRNYSFVQAHGERPQLEFLIRILPDGAMSNYLGGQCKTGDRIEIRGPKGGFSLREGRRAVVLLAGGTGLSAILSIAQQLTDQSHAAPIELFYGVTDPADLALTDRLDDLARRNPLFRWQGIASTGAVGNGTKQGLVTDLLDEACFNGGDVDVYLCGPPGMVDATRQWLDAHRLGNANLYYEKFLPSGASSADRRRALAELKVDPVLMRQSGAGTAVVIGGSIAGIAAAKVLSEKFDRVIILEKDPTHQKMEGRPGAAQGWHLHHLLIAGQDEIERIFPGVIDDMVRAGAFKVDMGEQYRLFLVGAWKKPIKSGIEIVCAGRPLLEWCLRRRLDREPSIKYHYDSELCDLVIDPESDTVVGVIADCGGKLTVLACEFVVDAAGKNTPLPLLLEKHGYDKPDMEMDDINCFYSSMRHRVPPERVWKDRVMTIAYPYRPHQKYYAAQYFIDSSRTILSTSLIGYDCYDPPRNAEEFREFAKRMPTQQIGDELDGLEAVSPVYNFRYPTMQRFDYRRVNKYPGAIVAVGDSLASADPVSGAGMTKAFLEIAALRDLLRRPDLRDSKAALAYYRKVGTLGDQIWSVIREQTLRYPWIRDVEKKRKPLFRLKNWYVDRLMEAIHEYPELYRTFLAVTHFVSPATALMRPAVVARVMVKWLGTKLRFRKTLIEEVFGPYNPAESAAPKVAPTYADNAGI